MKHFHWHSFLCLYSCTYFSPSFISYFSLLFLPWLPPWIFPLGHESGMSTFITELPSLLPPAGRLGNCSHPVVPEHGGFRCESSPCRGFSQKTTIHFFCEPGFHIPGKVRSARCRHGRWMPSIPPCMPLKGETGSIHAAWHLHLTLQLRCHHGWAFEEAENQRRNYIRCAHGIYFWLWFWKSLVRTEIHLEISIVSANWWIEPLLPT